MRALGGAGGRPPASNQCLAAQHEAGATQRRTDPCTASRRPHRRCVDRSVDCCADWRTLPSERSEQRAARPRTRAVHAPPVGWQPSLRRGPPSGDASPAAARTSPPLAALTGVPLRPLVREPRTHTAESRPGAGRPARGGGNPAPQPAPTRQRALAPARR